MLIAKREIEYPILFQGDMVRKILARHKTVTRRLNTRWLRVKKGQHIWVRETCSAEHPALPSLGGHYDADGAWILRQQFKRLPWWYSKRVCPSIHMPRSVCRILLVATADASLENLHNISHQPNEIRNEGLDVPAECPEGTEWGYDAYFYGYEKPWIDLWDSIHGKGAANWEANPEVVRVPFEIEEAIR